MAAKEDFTFVIAVYTVSKKLINKDAYTSIVLAVLSSTILVTTTLQVTISHYNKLKEIEVRNAEILEIQRMTHAIVAEIEQTDNTCLLFTVFLCIQTQSESSWGLFPAILKYMLKLGMEVIDHRYWHSKELNATFVNEIYMRDEYIEVDKEKCSRYKNYLDSKAFY